ncbi:MAG: acetyl-CoA C-acyltransferase [Proteobacteria bacterium]|nr:acetyl-CoA C-acyltransferase [Pseudomonadota bacterium]
MSDPVVITGLARTPMGGLQGVFADVTAHALGAAAIREAVARAGAPNIDQTIMGCVLGAGQGQAPARQASKGAGLGDDVPATTINKMCGSGMQAAILAHDMLKAESADCVVAGGMESMTNAPYLLARHRKGARFGHDAVLDSMLLDGLEDAYDKGKPMGAFAEDTARAYQIGRAEQDEYALRSLARAKAAQTSGAFDAEIVPVMAGKEIIRIDEQPGRAKPEKIPSLKPAFAPDGSITAASSASISDGAAALVLSRESRAKTAPLARIIGHAAHAQAPALFTTAPVFAVRKLLDRIGWRASDVDLFEINEAFAVVALVAMRELDIAPDRINVHGGACALGHPIGASGARILATLISALRAKRLKRGVASLCIGGGEATAMAVEIAR